MAYLKLSKHCSNILKEHQFQFLFYQICIKIRIIDLITRIIGNSFINIVSTPCNICFVFKRFSVDYIFVWIINIICIITLVLFVSSIHLCNNSINCLVFLIIFAVFKEIIQRHCNI